MGECVPFPGPARRAQPEPEPLWRSVLGARLRRQRQRKGLSLTRTAQRAGISAQYLSEIERGRKEPSSEIVAAVAGALDLSVLEIASLTVADLRRRAPQRPSDPTALAA